MCTCTRNGQALANAHAHTAAHTIFLFLFSTDTPVHACALADPSKMRNPMKESDSLHALNATVWPHQVSKQVGACFDEAAAIATTAAASSTQAASAWTGTAAFPTSWRACRCVCRGCV